MENAEIDMRIIARHLGASIDEEALRRELLGEDREHGEEDFTGRLLDDDSEGSAGLLKRLVRKFTK
jgi:hypothetical protein